MIIGAFDSVTGTQGIHRDIEGRMSVWRADRYWIVAVNCRLDDIFAIWRCDVAVIAAL